MSRALPSAAEPIAAPSVDPLVMWTLEPATDWRDSNSQGEIDSPESREIISDETRNPNTKAWDKTDRQFRFPARHPGIRRPMEGLSAQEPINGRWAIENEGIAPDIEIEITPADAAAGRDPQIERAVQEAMKLLDKTPLKRVPRPAPIDRTKRTP